MDQPCVLAPPSTTLVAAPSASSLNDNGNRQWDKGLHTIHMGSAVEALRSFMPGHTLTNKHTSTHITSGASYSQCQP